MLPKLHGTRAKLDKPIQDLLAFCYDPNPNILIDISEEKRKQAEQFDTSACFPRSAQKSSQNAAQFVGTRLRQFYRMTIT